MQINRALVKNVLDIYIRVGMESMDAYEADFEAELLTSTAAYYKRKVGQDDPFPAQRMHELCAEKQDGFNPPSPTPSASWAHSQSAVPAPSRGVDGAQGRLRQSYFIMNSGLLHVHSGFVAVFSSYSCFLSLQL